MVRFSLAVVAVAGCGRIGFAARDQPGAAVDAVVAGDAPATALVAHAIANTQGSGSRPRRSIRPAPR
jgi:hypothetical protein